MRSVRSATASATARSVEREVGRIEGPRESLETIDGYLTRIRYVLEPWSDAARWCTSRPRRSSRAVACVADVGRGDAPQDAGQNAASSPVDAAGPSDAGGDA